MNLAAAAANSTGFRADQSSLAARPDLDEASICRLKTELSQPPRIIAAAEKDLPELARLAGAIWRAVYPGILSNEQIEFMLAKMYAIETLRAEIRTGICFDRLLIGGEFVGFAAYGATSEKGVFKLHKLYLKPEFQGRGLGTHLLQHCEAEVRKCGARRLFLTVNKRNVKAIAAYERNGFAIETSVVTEIGGGFVMDDFVMTKAWPLNPTSDGSG